MICYTVIDKVTMDELVDRKYRDIDSRDGRESQRKAWALEKALNHLHEAGYTLIAISEYGYVFAEN